MSKERINGTFQSYRHFAVAPLMTIVLYSIILAVKGIYPFGKLTIDYYDMAQQIAAFYYHTYDMLHGTKGFFYDWYTALGANMAMGTSGCSNISPFNLFFLFIKREHLLESLSVFNGLKMALMSLSMYIFLYRTHREAPYLFRILGSVGYSFCGFVLMLYITNQWLDVAVLFPIMMYFYERALTEGRIRGYVISLALIFICSYYLGIMCLIFLFLLTGLNLFSRSRFFVGSDSDSSKGLHIVEFGTGTALGILLSSFIVVPQVVQMLGSARFHNGNASAEGRGLIGWYMNILTHVKGDYTTRWWTLLGVSLACAVIVVGFIRMRHNRRVVYMSVSLVLLVTLELFFESINLFWHFGSYVQYPIRNGFIISFTFIYLLCFYAKELFLGDISPSLTSWIVGLAIAVLGFSAFAVFMNTHPGLPLRRVFHITSAMMSVTLIYYLVLTAKHSWSNKRSGWMAGMFVCELLCYGFLLFGRPTFITGYTEEPEQSGEFIHISDQLREAFDLEPQQLIRVKNPDESLNANYGIVLMQPALSNWTHMIAPNEQSSAGSWGYSIEYTRLLDAGGTIASDALLGVQNVISLAPMDERLYTPIKTAPVIIDSISGETAEYTMYRPKYTMPFGMLLSDSADSGNGMGNVVELHNRLYRQITGEDEDLAKWYVSGSSNKDLTIRTSGAEALYFMGSGPDQEYANSVIEIETPNGWKAVNVATIGYPDNTYYPAHFNNNAVYLGCFDNEDVHIRVTQDPDKGPEFPISVFGVSLEGMDKLCSFCKGVSAEEMNAGKQSLSFTVSDTYMRSDHDAVLIPLTFDEGWTITVNGTKVSASEYAGLFTRIPLSSGSNEIEMHFVPRGLWAGVALTALTLLIMVVYIVIYGRLGKDIRLERANTVLTAIYRPAFLAVTLFMYIIPIVYGLLFYLHIV